jgi:hypothetical protein
MASATIAPAVAETTDTSPKQEERNHMRNGLFHLATGASLAIALSASPALAQKKYDTGATDTEIKVGQTLAFSGPASAYATIGKTQAAYIQMINDQGGINGRKITLIQYDDAYSPPKAVEQMRKLVESDEVLLTFQVLGTPSNAAVQKYLNSKKVPQLYAATGASRFTDPKNFPWTMGYNPNYFVEGRIYGQYILKNHPSAKVGILYQNDDLGKDYLNGIKAGLGDKAASMIVAEASYEVSDPTIDSQILKIKDAGADLFFSATTPKFRAQLAPRPHPRHQRDLGRRGAAAGGTRGLEGRDQRQLRQGSGRSDLEGRSRHEEISRLHGEVLSGRRQGFAVQHLWLFDRPASGLHAEAVRRRPDARERDEAGDLAKRSRAGLGAARDQAQHLADRLPR